MSCIGRCDTCDSKKAKTLVMCARVRARERGSYSYINTNRSLDRYSAARYLFNYDSYHNGLMTDWCLSYSIALRLHLRLPDSNSRDVHIFHVINLI